MLRPESVGSTMKVFGELLNRVQIASSGARRVVATLEFFEHPVSELSHNDLLVTLTYRQPLFTLPPPQMQHPPRQRLSSNGNFGNLSCMSSRSSPIPGTYRKSRLHRRFAESLPDCP